VCPIGDCTATVRFEASVVEVTPRYRLHDLDEVDEFATCPSCDAQVAGFYEETEGEADGVELILDIDGDEAADGDGGDSDGHGGGVSTDDDAVGDDGFDAPADVLDGDG